MSGSTEETLRSLNELYAKWKKETIEEDSGSKRKFLEEQGLLALSEEEQKMWVRLEGKRLASKYSPKEERKENPEEETEEETEDMSVIETFVVKFSGALLGYLESAWKESEPSMLELATSTADFAEALWQVTQQF